MTRYKVHSTYIASMGSIDSFLVDETLSQTKEEYALWYLNTMRNHDGLPLWRNLPVKLTYTKLSP